MKLKLLPVARLFMFQCILTMILAFPFANAQAQQVQQQGQQINSYFYQGDSVNLGQQLGLGQLIRQGKEILSISVKAQATQFDSKIILKLNGQKLQGQQLSQAMSLKSFAVPFIQQGDNLKLVVRGGAFIKAVKVKFQDRYTGGQGQGQASVLKAVIRKQVYSGETLPIKRLVKDHTGVRLNGKKALKVIMKASSHGYASAQLIINGYPVGYSQSIPSYEERMVFTLPQYDRNIMGQDLRQIAIRVSGNAFVKMVGIKVKQGHQGGGYQNSIQVNIHRTFRGSERVALRNLMGYNTPNGQKQVEAITITARGNGSIRIAGAGQSQGAMQVHSRHGQSQIVRIFGFASIQDLKLRVNGNLTIETLRVKFKGRQF